MAPACPCQWTPPFERRNMAPLANAPPPLLKEETQPGPLTWGGGGTNVVLVVGVHTGLHTAVFFSVQSLCLNWEAYGRGSLPLLFCKSTYIVLVILAFLFFLLFADLSC